MLTDMGQTLLDAIYRYDIVKGEYVKYINDKRVSDALLEQNLNDAWYALDRAQKDYLKARSDSAS
jgi:hypothetical protein